MKAKMRHHAQPRERLLVRNEQVRREITDFLKAIDSYPASAAKDPRLNFQRHLCAVFAASINRERRQI